jgi:hypothetical protein
MIDRNVIWEENVKEEGNEKNGEGIRLCIFTFEFGCLGSSSFVGFMPIKKAARMSVGC